MAMWAVFAKSFQTQLTAVLGYDAATAKQITKTAKPKYKEIIAKLPEFEKRDRFQLNIIGCAMLGGVRPLYAKAAGCRGADGIL